MSKRRGASAISLPLPATLDWCKRTAGRCWRGVCGIVSSVTNGRGNDQFEVARLTKIRRPLQVDSCEEGRELKEFIKAVSIGDRVRVLCDDGVLVAEKISHTQFKLIDSQVMSKFIH